MALENVQIPKGVAMLIRTVLNIDPAKIEAQLNEFLAKAHNGIGGAQKMLQDFDGRLQALEAANKELASEVRRLMQQKEGENVSSENERQNAAAAIGNGNGIGSGGYHSPAGTSEAAGNCP